MKLIKYLSALIKEKRLNHLKRKAEKLDEIITRVKENASQDEEMFHIIANEDVIKLAAKYWQGKKDRVLKKLAKLRACSQ